MDTLLHHLLQFASLNPQQLALIRDSLEVRRWSPGSYFLQAGQVAHEVGFITEGVFRVIYYDKDGSEITRYFLAEGGFNVDLNSYNTGLPSTEYIQALTDCEMLVLTRPAMDNLSRTIVDWDKMIAKISAKALMDKVMRVSLMMPEDAKARYENFLKNFPGLANRIPLQYIASYIGVTKSSLSRIRREMGT
jgi:CRP-like cAMP-binding protein